MGQKIIYDIEVKSDDAVQGVKKLNKEVDKTGKKVKETGEAGKQSFAGLDSATGGLITKFGSLKGSLKVATTGFNTLRGAIIGTGIGALVIGILAVGKAFTSSEEGQNKFSEIMGQIGAVTGNLIDLFADFGEAIISVFENPKKAITDFAALVKNNITNRFEGMLELVPQLGKAMTLLFSGKFGEAAETAGNAMGKVVLGVDNVSDSVRKAGQSMADFAEQNKKEAAAAKQVAKDRATADKVERGLLVDRAKAENEIANLRLIAKDLNNTTAKERETALKRVMAIEDSLIGREQEVANLRRDAQIQENSFARSTKENLDEAEKLKAEAIAVGTRRLNKQRAVQRELTTAESEINSERKRVNDEVKAEGEAAQKIIDDKAKADKKIAEDKIAAEKERLKKFISDNAEIIEDARQQREEKELYAYNEAKRTEDDRNQTSLDNLLASKEQGLITQDEYNARIIEQKNLHIEKINEIDKTEEERLEEEKEAKFEKDFEGIQTRLDDEANSFEDRRTLLAEQRQLILDDETLSEEERNKMLKANSDASVEIKEAEGAAKMAALDAYAGAAQAIGSLLGEETAAGKAFSVAAATISTYTSATKAYESRFSSWCGSSYWFSKC